MSLLTAATIEVGKAVAKSILKFWMKDSALGEDISSSLIDLVGSKTSDAIAQRKGNRQFEDIGDKISVDILPLLESERIRLAESDRRAVTLAVAEALSKLRISTELLLNQNLQPVQLEQHVLAANPTATRDFSETATFLYQSIIKQCCIYIIDISSQLPSFTEHTFAEVLKREDLIITKVDDILNELRKMREQLNPTDKANRFEKEYREAVARNLDVLQLIGTDVSLSNRRHKLTVAYITLSVVQKEFLPKPIDDLAKNIVSVDTALSSSRRILIRGLAGSGKTTLLQWIAVRAATKSFEGSLASRNGFIPFYIRLRHYAQVRLPKPEAFPDFSAPAIVGTMPKGWVHGILREGRAIVLVDGVDEVSAAQQEEVHTWLRDLIHTYKDKDNCFIVTTRPHAVEDGWMNNEAFNDVMLQEMALVNIFSFIDHWHEAVKQELHLDEEKNELAPLTEYLKEQVRRTRAIRNLATNPLLCAVLCALNRERRRQLPVNRIELYKACCSLLLERREKESHIDLSDYPVLNYSQKQRLLEDLAYRMLEENLSEIETEEVDEAFTRKLPNMPNLPPETTGKAVRKLFVERLGIIRELAAGQIDFAHRTFQEFFAAQAVLDAMDINKLVTKADNDQWREVIILAAGLAPRALCEQLVRGLIDLGDKKKERRYQLHLLAVACLEATVELASEVRIEVEKRLSQLVPPKSLSDANALAAAGELAVKHLDKKQLEQKGEFPAITYAACIKALALIGGDVAIDMLEGYANDTREVVINELLKAWDLFDREVYARRILSQTLQNQSYLRLERIPSLDGIQHFTSLTQLDLSGCTQISEVKLLACLTNLSWLDLSGCTQLDDLRPLASLTNLRELNLTGCTQLDDLRPLASLTNLRRLNLANCPQLSDISLTDLTNLRRLNLANCPQLSDISLTDLTNLSELNLIGCPQLNDISLTNLTNLTGLSLAGCVQLSNVSFIGLTNLILLSLAGCIQLSDVKLLASLTSLTQLDLSDCPQLSDVKPLASLTNLRELNLTGCTQLSDVKPLASLTNLCELDLTGCPLLSDVKPLASLTNLRRLNLANCTQLSDVKPLASLTNLRSLDLTGCPLLSDVKPLASLTNLCNLDLTDCPLLSDIKPLASLTNLYITR